MRKIDKALIPCIVLAGGLAVAGGAIADETCQAGAWTVSTTGPQVVGGNTTITYSVSGSPSPDHLAAVVSSGSTNCLTPSPGIAVTGPNATGNQTYAPAVGDPITGLGKGSCHDEAVKLNPSPSKVEFTISVSGSRAAQPKTVVVKKGNTVKGCEIVGIGDPGTPEVVAPVTEIIKEPSSTCAVEFTRDLNTGKVLQAALVQPSHPDCKLFQTSADKLQIKVVNDTTVCGPTGECSLGDGKFGEGYVHTGTNSCTTRIIGGRVYTWGADCPE